MSSRPNPTLAARTVPGLHNCLLDLIKNRVPPTDRVLDVGCGTGAFVDLLTRSGYNNVTAVDRSRNGYAARVRFFAANLDQPFAGSIAKFGADSSYDLITAVEVLEHLENPSHFLRECRKLLAVPAGRLLVTSPNVECVPGRLKFMLTGNLRHFDEHGDPTHITPILSSRFHRLAHLTGYQVEAQFPGPSPRRFHGSRAATTFLARCLAPVLRGSLWGDCNIFILSLH